MPMLPYFASGDTVLGIIFVPAREIAILLTYICTCSTTASDSAFDFISSRGNCILSSHPPTPIYSWDFTPGLCRWHGSFCIAGARYWASSGFAAVRVLFRPHSPGGGTAQLMSFLHSCSGDQKRGDETANHHDHTPLCARPCPSCGTSRRSTDVSLSEVHGSGDRKDDDSILGTIGYLMVNKGWLATSVACVANLINTGQNVHALCMEGRKELDTLTNPSPPPNSPDWQ